MNSAIISSVAANITNPSKRFLLSITCIVSMFQKGLGGYCASPPLPPIYQRLTSRSGRESHSACCGRLVCFRGSQSRNYRPCSSSWLPTLLPFSNQLLIAYSQLLALQFVTALQSTQACGPVATYIATFDVSQLIVKGGCLRISNMSNPKP